MITRIDYKSADGVRIARVMRNDSCVTSWNISIAGTSWRTDEVSGYLTEDHHVRSLTKAQQIARTWCDDGRKP